MMRIYLGQQSATEAGQRRKGEANGGVLPISDAGGGGNIVSDFFQPLLWYGDGIAEWTDFQRQTEEEEGI
jgi:hypothetical protein